MSVFGATTCALLHLLIHISNPRFTHTHTSPYFFPTQQFSLALRLLLRMQKQW